MRERVLIVGTVPYNKKSTSRAFEAYFSKWERSSLAQVFSNTKKPAKGHCETLFQITDQRMLKRKFDRNIDTGKIFKYDDLPCEWADNSKELNSNFFSRLYKFGDNKTPVIYLLRKIVWSKKYWCTEKFNKWLDEFSPECVFLSFSDDFFIPEIALYVAERFNIPIVSSIGDDYYFNGHFSLSPFYFIYKHFYKKLIRKVFAHGGSAIYISDKIRDKYNKEFNLDGQTVYLTSELKRCEFSPVNKLTPVISYFGNIRQGRNYSLLDIANVLKEISEDYYLDVYSNQDTKSAVSVLEKASNIRFKGSIPYSEVLEKTMESDILVIVEGFKNNDVKNTRYSLSTKAADCLACGKQILVYGSSDCGVIEYMATTDSAMVCTKKEQLKSGIEKLINDIDFQKNNYNNSIKITNEHHNLDSSTQIFHNVVRGAIDGYTTKK